MNLYKLFFLNNLYKYYMTAVLENVNKFSYLGLRRRPTYDEIIGLIKENENLTGKLPNRDATFFKASNEGSFFDGLDHLEILKEQQNRILQRQVQDLLLRQNVRANGGTFHLERHLQSSSSSSDTSSSTELQPDRNTLSVGLQADLQRRQQQLRDRQQQTGEAHRSLISRATTPILEGLASLRRFPRTEASTPSEVVRRAVSEEEAPPARQQQTETFIIGSSSENEEEMLTAREQPKSKLMKSISYSTNIERWNEDELEFQLLIRGKDMNSPENSLEGMRKKGKGKGLTKSQYYRQTAQKMINDGTWDTRIEEQLLQSRINKYYDKSKPRGSKD